MYLIQDNYIALNKAYNESVPDEFGLYLGAGINLSSTNPFPLIKTYRWSELLETIYQINRSYFNCSFQELLKTSNYNWPYLATTLEKHIGRVRLIEQLDAIIYKNISRKDKYRRLSKKIFEHAPTLHATICFSSKIAEKTKTSWTFERNKKIGSILTTNYDFFFGAGWTCYQSFDKCWKVQTPFSEHKPNDKQRAVNYIHGYLPYYPGSTKDIVLTMEQYDQYYSEGGFAGKTLWNFLNNYKIIFLGTSFTDIPLQKMLRKIKSKQNTDFYAIDLPHMRDRIENLGILPIIIEHYSQIPELLSNLYCDAMDSNELTRVELKNAKLYWDRLKSGPNLSGK